jgi:hypothetical protein
VAQRRCEDQAPRTSDDVHKPILLRTSLPILAMTHARYTAHDHPHTDTARDSPVAPLGPPMAGSCHVGEFCIRGARSSTWLIARFINKPRGRGTTLTRAASSLTIHLSVAKCSPGISSMTETVLGAELPTCNMADARPYGTAARALLAGEI